MRLVQNTIPVFCPVTKVDTPLDDILYQLAAIVYPQRPISSYEAYEDRQYFLTRWIGFHHPVVIVYPRATEASAVFGRLSCTFSPSALTQQATPTGTFLLLWRLFGDFTMPCCLRSTSSPRLPKLPLDCSRS